jgi:hypothetical protein
MKYFFLLFITIIAWRSVAQTSRDTSVIETIFHKEAIHKDGYSAGNKIVDIPGDVAAEMDKKRVRITGFAEKPVEVHMEKDKVMQGRFQTAPDGRNFTAGAYFDVISISIWEKNRWRLIYPCK